MSDPMKELCRELMDELFESKCEVLRLKRELRKHKPSPQSALDQAIKDHPEWFLLDG